MGDDDDASNALGTDSKLSSLANSSNVVSVALLYKGACVLDSSTMLEAEKGMLDIEEFSEQPIHACILASVQSCGGEFPLGFYGFQSNGGDVSWRCTNLQSGEIFLGMDAIWFLEPLCTLSNKFTWIG